MSTLRQLVDRFRAWRLWRALRRPAGVPSLTAAPVRPILRDVTPHGVRVYSLCGCCGAHMGTSATLCEACARSRA